VVGVLTRSDALGALSERPRDATLGEVARRDWLQVEPTASLSDIVSGLRARGAFCALVVDGSDPPTLDAVRGLITKVEIADALAQASELYAG
jgi:CBS domain-containing protein